MWVCVCRVIVLLYSRRNSFWRETESAFNRSNNSLKEGRDEEGDVEGRGKGGEGGPSLKNKALRIICAQRPTLKNESVEGEGEEAGGSTAYAHTPSPYAHPPNSKLTGYVDSIMERLAEIQTDIKEKIEQVLSSHTHAIEENRRQCEKIEQVLSSHTHAIEANRRQCEKVEQVLASHTRAIVDAVHAAQVAIEVVRQTQAAAFPPSCPLSSGSWLASESVAPFESKVRQLPPASMFPLHAHSDACANHTPMPAYISHSPAERRRDVQAGVEFYEMQDPAPLNTGEPTCMSPPLHHCSPGLVDATLGEVRRRWGQKIIDLNRAAERGTGNYSTPACMSPL